METRNRFSRILAIVGTVLAWVPLLAPVVFFVASALQRRRVPPDIPVHAATFDYLMPAELFPVFAVGGALLLVAALLARSRRLLVICSLAFAVILVVGGQAVAVVTGLASGETEFGGWQSVLVIAMLIASALSMAATGVGGLLLATDVFRRRRPEA